MSDAAHDLILLQEAPERLIKLVFLLLIARHFQHHERACLLALGQIKIRDAAAGKLADATIASYECAAETLRILRIGRSAPIGPGDGLFLRGGAEHRDQLAMLDVFAVEHPLGAQMARLARRGFARLAAQED